MAAVQLPPGLQTSALSGPLILGFILNWGLYGVLCVQCYFYYVAFPKDRAAVKCLVLGLLAMETTQSLMVIYDAFSLYATGYGQIGLLNDPPLIWLIVPIMSGIVSCTVQIFFAYRVIILSGSKTLGVIITALALLEGIAAIIVGAQMEKAVFISSLLSTTFITKAVWLSGSAFCDIVIAVAMVYLLLSKRNPSTVSETQARVNRLVRLIIETGSLTALTAIADLFLFFSFPNQGYHIVPCLIMSKFYATTTLAILNSRMHISEGRNNPPSAELGTLGILSFNVQENEGGSQVRGTNIYSRSRTPVSSVGVIRTTDLTWSNTGALVAPITVSSEKLNDSSNDDSISEDIQHSHYANGFV